MGKAKFKVGDRVRIMAGHGMEDFGAKTGMIGTVAENGSRCPFVKLDGVARPVAVSEEHLVAAFKVGDKVRFTKDNPNGGSEYGAKGQIVEVMRVFGAAGGLEWGPQVDIKHPSFSWHPSASISALEPLPVAELAPAALTIQAGRYYKTRDGRKVGPTWLIDVAPGWPWTAGGGVTYRDNGMSHVSGEPWSHDLIAEWVDEPVAQPAQASNDNPAPAFKVGDRVKFVNGRRSNEDFNGLTATIVGVGDDYDWVLRLDAKHLHGHRCCGKVEGGFGRYADSEELELVGEATPGPKFKVGDIVNYTVSCNSWQGIKITGVQESAGCYLYDCAHPERGEVTFLESHLELANQPKFKVGDRVRYRTTEPSYGAEYTDKDLTVIKIGGGDFGDIVDLDYGDGGYTQTTLLADIELVTTTTNAAIVALIENGQPKPADRPHVHPSREAATKEAARLAGRYPGKEFGVYELVSTAREEAVYLHEWQRLAAGGQTYDAKRELATKAGVEFYQAATIVNDWLKAAA